MIHCAKCETVNSVEQRYCQKCHADLLPGEGLGTRIAYLVAAGLITAAGVYVLLRIINGQVPADLECALTSPVFWGLLVMMTPIWGLIQAFRPTPPHTRYLNRAKRHAGLDAQQALADLNHALELAPEKERAGILKERAKMHQQLGLNKEATRDKLAYAEDEGAYQGGAAFAGLTGIDSDTFVNGLRKGAQKELVKSGEAVALGYCPKCKDAVLLDEKLHCKIHRRSKIHEIRYVIPDDVEKIRPELLQSYTKKTRQLLVRRLITLAALMVGCGALYYVVELNPSDKLPKATTTEQAAINPVGQATADPQVFDEYGFRFQYPGGWKIIQESDQDTLLNTSLKGMDASQAEYIGGVYSVGLDNCQGCAQIVIVVVKDPALPGTLTDEQFEAAKQANQATMGDRLLAYNRITVGSSPASESKHIGRSGESQLWELIIMPNQPGVAYLFSMSSSREDYASYEPHFQTAVDTLEIEAGD